MDPVTNWAEYTVSAGYSAGATSITLTADPTTTPSSALVAPCNGWYWNATDYPRPMDDPNREMIRLTNVSGATLTIVRGQEGTSASAKNTSGKVYKVAFGPTAKTFNTDIPADIASAVATGVAAVAILATTGQPGSGVGVARQLAWDTAAQALYIKDPTNGWTPLLQL